MAYFFLSQQTTEEILRKANIDFIPAIREFKRWVQSTLALRTPRYNEHPDNTRTDSS